jgi:hypothetical protein
MKIYKFIIPLQSTPFVYMPKGANIVSCQIQDEKITVWALCDPNAEKAKRYFAVVNTGEEFSNVNLRFIATVQLGAYVYHVHEII